ncbi:bHLH/Zip transcription factor [Exophiala xenobiotica]|nr:bHLH/Zip transcription factor [Exophiala xenobiotica]KAK5295984.1 bHLH/Zip transcription factor [Exophiala xenobiotica]KAK5492398.1 bHLH/Zip transcription factor [Exophiala xenobiotica]
MPYSQMFNQYQDTSPYDNQQPWNEVDFTTSMPPNDNFKSTDDPSFYDFNGLRADNQNAPSPNYSQFLNFDSSEVGSYSLPSEDISPNRFNGPQAPINYSIKHEPDLSQNDSFACGLRRPSGECSPQRCGPEPACVQLTNLSEIEDCNSTPCLTTDTNTVFPFDTVRKTSRSNSRESIPRPKEERERKVRTKRGHKGSSSDEDSAQLRAKQAHSVVERRYRDNLNGKIMQLHRALVATEATSRLTGMPNQDFYAPREHRGKVRKSDVMTDAMNYIHQTEVEVRHMSDEINRLNERVQSLQKLVKCEDCTLLKQMVRLQLQQKHPK